MSLPEALERSAPYTCLGLDEPLRGGTRIADHTYDLRHAFDRPAIDELCERENILACTFEEAEDRSALLPFMERGPSRAELALNLTWSSNRTGPVFEANGFCDRREGFCYPMRTIVSDVNSKVGIARFSGAGPLRIRPAVS